MKITRFKIKESQSVKQGQIHNNSKQLNFTTDYSSDKCKPTKWHQGLSLIRCHVRFEIFSCDIRCETDFREAETKVANSIVVLAKRAACLQTIPKEKVSAGHMVSKRDSWERK